VSPQRVVRDGTKVVATEGAANKSVLQTVRDWAKEQMRQSDEHKKNNLEHLKRDYADRVLKLLSRSEMELIARTGAKGYMPTNQERQAVAAVMRKIEADPTAAQLKQVLLDLADDE
jgi:hypothetical protein